MGESGVSVWVDGYAWGRLPWRVVGRGRRKYKMAFPLVMRVLL